MAQNTDLNVSPYYDDYSESKNFHRILFRPANAIQARELTQLQTIIQNQVERFGNHIFDEGSLVSGGTITANTEYSAVKVENTNPNGSGTATAETYRAAAVGKFYQGKTTGVVAKVINSSAQSGDDPLTLYVNYVASGNPTGTTFYTTFADAEEIEEVSVNSSGVYSNASNSDNEFKTITPTDWTAHTASTSTGSAATVRSGIFYTRGFFVRCDEQTIILDKYTNTPTYRIGLQITESLISSTDDDSLKDNATGTTNENAPGANRLKITLELVKKAVSGTQDIDNFIELCRIESGIITSQKVITTYSTLEKTLARRTYDESGDYVVKPFQMELREHLNTKTNNGVYLSGDTTTPGDKTKFVGVISSGKAYVKGHEVDEPAPNLVTFDKARTTKDSGAISIPFEIGNYFKVTKTFGQPEFAPGDSALTPFGTIDLHADKKGSQDDNTSSGDLIGRARCRFYNEDTQTYSNGVSADTSTFKCHLFDVRMFTEITFSGSNYALTAGQRVKGTSSGAKGTVAVNANHNATTLWLMDVEGTFTTSDTIRLEHLTSGGKGSITAVTTHSSDRVRSLYQASETSGSANFTADTVLTDHQYPLSGTVFIDQSDDPDKIVGTNSKFTQELKVGDVVVFDDNSTGIIDGVTSDTEASLSADLSADYSGRLIRQRARLLEQEKTVAIAAAPKDFVSSITPNLLTLRKQKAVTLSSGTGSITGVSNETPLGHGNTGDYLITVMEGEGTESAAGDNNEGDTVQVGEDVSSNDFVNPTQSAGGSIAITASGSNPVAGADQLKIQYTITKSDTSASAKTLNKSRGVKVTSLAADAPGSGADPSDEIYGTNYNDEIISLGVPDVYAVRGIYESLGVRSDGTSNALPPKMTLASGFGACNPGDKLTGSSTGAVGRVIQKTGNNIFFYYQTTAEFTTADTVKNEHNTDTNNNTRACTAITKNESKDITNNFLIDDGQRDGYYGLGSIRRKPGVPTPAKEILVIFDYFTAAGGNYFTVNSYNTLNYENIPSYISRITDPSGFEPDGEYELADAVDFRPYVHSLHDVSAALDPTAATNVSSIAAQPFAYATEEFTSARAVTFDLPKSGTGLSTTAFSHYLPRVDIVSLSTGGQLEISTGVAAEEPVAPSVATTNMILHTLNIPPYTRDISQVEVRSEDHRRFTMRDIGRIQGRVRNLERVTSFNILEQSTSLRSITDADGIERFKSGFVTDNFRGHKTGDVHHPDYKNSMDQEFGSLRPEFNSRNVDITYNANLSTGCEKTGDLITLPWSEVNYVNVDKASQREFVNPYDVVLFRGNINLAPTGDQWFDTRRLPAINMVTEGDYDAVVAGVSIGTVWNNWQTDWSGVNPAGDPGGRRVRTVPEGRRWQGGTANRPFVNNSWMGRFANVFINRNRRDPIEP